MAIIELHKKSDNSAVEVDTATIAVVRPMPGTPGTPATAMVAATPEYCIISLAGAPSAASFLEVTETASQVTVLMAAHEQQPPRPGPPMDSPPDRPLTPTPPTSPPHPVDTPPAARSAKSK